MATSVMGFTNVDVQLGAGHRDCASSFRDRRELLHPSVALGKAVRLSEVLFELMALKSWE